VHRNVDFCSTDLMCAFIGSYGTLVQYMDPYDSSNYVVRTPERVGSVWTYLFIPYCNSILFRTSYKR
jgi:hypothetical protein